MDSDAAARRRFGRRQLRQFTGLSFPAASVRVFQMSTKKGHQKVPLHWRRGRDSNPRVVSHKLISSQPRYDRFDTSPNPILLPVREQKSGRLPADTRYIIPHIREKSKSFFEKTGEI